MIRHARSHALAGQAPRHARRKLYNQARLRSLRMRGGRPRLSRETTLDSELQRDFGSVVRINQSTAAQPAVPPQRTILAAASRPVRKVRKVHRRSGGRAARQGSRRRKNKKRGKGRRKKKGRKRRKKKKGQKGRRRGHRRRHRVGGSTNSTRTKGKRKRKNPHLPFRVPTALPSPGANATSGRSPGAAGTNSSESDGERHATLPGNEEEEVEELSSSSEMSLPKYLRHRGRRQLGEGGGIIQAPLLSACKPGAKRDYNYKCRPKFIPQGRDRRRVVGVSIGPRRPTISCPKGTRLDPRGKCQQIG